MKLSIIIPVFNEEKTLAKIISKVKRSNLPLGISKEVVVVDDASFDNSLKTLNAIDGIRVHKHKENRGKGAAVVTGIKNTTGEIILIQDADLEYNPSDYSKLLKPILDGKTKVVYGTRLKNLPLKLFGKDKTPHPLHYVGNRFLTFLTNLLYGNDISDMETGYKVIKREVLKGIDIRARRFDFEPEITAKILKQGFSIYEVPIKVNPRGYDEGKKITWLDGFSAVWTLIKYKFID